MKIREIIIAVSLLLFVFSFHVISDDALTISLTPGLNLPLGESSDIFSPGGGLNMSGSYELPFSPLFSLKGELGYLYIPIRTKDGVSAFSAGGGIRFSYPLHEKVTLSAYGTVGYYYGLLTDGSGTGGGNLYATGGIGIYYNPLPVLSFGLDVHYLKKLFLYDGIGFSIGSVYHLSRQIALKRRTEGKLPLQPQPLKISKIELDSVFPVLFKHYDNHTVGRATIFNEGPNQIEDISVHFFVERYMDNPKQCATLDKLKKGEEAEIDLYALFSDRVLEITEGTKVSAKITCEYTYGNQIYSNEFTETLRLYNRNAVTWDDDRKAAAFVTSRDPMVMEFAKNVASWIKGASSTAINNNLSLAMALHEALRLTGVSYVLDPTTPFTEFSQNMLAIDYLQFPRQTLKYVAGDCDDLSILYSALLESVGIETAFITIPGHIFMAFSLDMPQEVSRTTFLSPDEFIFREGNTWVPVEITMVQSFFQDAWLAGAKEWREHSTAEQARFYPMHDSWQEYEPVGLPGGETEVSLPDQAQLLTAYSRGVELFIDRELYPRVSLMQEQIEKSNNDPKYVNKLGVLYAKYGLKEKAVQQFSKILERNEYVPALVNMGNIYFLDQKMEKALKYRHIENRRLPAAVKDSLNTP